MRMRIRYRCVSSFVFKCACREYVCIYLPFGILQIGSVRFTFIFYTLLGINFSVLFWSLNWVMTPLLFNFISISFSIYILSLFSHSTPFPRPVHSSFLPKRHNHLMPWPCPIGYAYGRILTRDSYSMTTFQYSYRPIWRANKECLHPGQPSKRSYWVSEWGSDRGWGRLNSECVKGGAD